MVLGKGVGKKPGADGENGDDEERLLGRNPRDRSAEQPGKHGQHEESEAELHYPRHGLLVHPVERVGVLAEEQAVRTKQGPGNPEVEIGEERKDDNTNRRRDQERER